jgi:hypothetical protein
LRNPVCKCRRKPQIAGGAAGRYACPKRRMQHHSLHSPHESEWQPVAEFEQHEPQHAIARQPAAPTVGQTSDMDPGYSERLRLGLTLAVSRAVVMLRKSGRPDLVVPVYQLKVNELLALQNSVILALARPPGNIFLDHQRTEVLGSLNDETNASDNSIKRRGLRQQDRITQPENATQSSGSNDFTMEEP